MSCACVVAVVIHFVSLGHSDLDLDVKQNPTSPRGSKASLVFTKGTNKEKRMAPSIKYPITKEIFTPVNPAHLKGNPPMLDGPPTLEQESKSSSQSALACLKSSPVDNYLKSVFRFLRDPFEIIFETNFTMTVHSPEGIPFFEWSITFRKILKKGNYMLLDVLGVLNEGLFQCYSLLKNINKLDETDIDDLKKLKKEIFMLAGYLDNILMFYSSGGRKQDKPVVQEVKRVAKKCRNYLRDLKPAMLHRVIPSFINVKEEEILGVVLGLDDLVVDRLSKLEPDVRSHQTDMYFILGFLEENSKYSGSLTDKINVSTKLQEMGFTENRSGVVAKWICEQPYPEHQQLYSWVQDYIEKLFMYDIFLNDTVSNYPFHENTTDKWFTVRVEHYDEDEDGEEERVIGTDVPVFNTTVDKVDHILKEQQQYYQNNNPGKCLYFHGTDHDGAKRILEDGINPGASKRRCELSDGYGFYLSTDSKFSINWSKKHDASAIVVFNIEDYLGKFQSLDLTVPGSASDLEKLKNYCRASERLPKELKQKYETCDYVKAPISQAPGHQICVIKEAMADEIGEARKINSVIFVNSIKKPRIFTKGRKKEVYKNF